MEDRIILSICIPSHNRADVILKNLEDILKIGDDRFDIVITDTSDRRDIFNVRGLEKNKTK